ncbi:efflux RND transporter periplasmic adaptor subunit [Shewanella salipaludis]|uniref:Efflux RND transporter periplasmic adaptor subunit n=1 Tax=Shewanella salipaludis TaxID=2723052 RepID=A0A972G0Z4_9GAMM|nr:efflux RND transporter periplasmic adaptor subunit [Shewanella salipaludis]NMH65521.1 efflux RND transporter periplasmic adaptor subunit [Shewanella salipaludis]
MAITRHSILLPLTLAVAATWLLGACQDEATPQAQVSLPVVSTQTLTQAAYYQHRQTYTGTIRSGNTTAIGFELAGKLDGLAVDSGDSVKAGQVLATLDTRLLLAEQQELKASLAQNQADLDLAQTTLARNLQLKQQGYVSAQTLDENQRQLNGLQAGKQRLLASLQVNRLKLDKSALLAPFDGKISKRHHNPSEVVALGSPVFTLIGATAPQAYIGVPVAVAQTLTQGQAIELTVAEQEFDASIAGISAEVDPVSRTVQLRVKLPLGAAVINGELAYLHYQQTIAQPGYWVPLAALTDGMRGLWNLYVLKAAEGDYLLERRDVDILYTSGDRAFIRGAIADDEAYVSQGLHKLVIGQRVKPVAAGTDLALSTEMTSR